jgi:hypothetical protein
VTSGATARLRRQGRNAVDRHCGAYEAFGKGDISAILDKLDENVAWDTQADVPGVPWLSPRRGKANVPAFFESLAPLHFHPLRAAHLLHGRRQGVCADSHRSGFKGKALRHPERRPLLDKLLLYKASFAGSPAAFAHLAYHSSIGPRCRSRHL